MDDDEPSLISFDFSLHIADDIDVRLGLLTRSWSALEYMIVQMTGTLLAISEDEARAVFTQMNVRPRLEIAQILAPNRLIYKKDRDAFLAHRAAIQKAQETRNLLIHGLWCRDNDGQHVILQPWGGKDGAHRMEPKIHRMDIASLDAKVAEVLKAVVEFMNWWKSDPALMPPPYEREPTIAW